MDRRFQLKPVDILRILVGYRYSYASEIDLQDGVAAALRENQLTFDKEYSLDKLDRPDFFMPQLGLVIEVKIKSPMSQVLRQLHRYAVHEEVKAILLVTTRSCHAVPAAMESKPILVLNVGRL